MYSFARKVKEEIIAKPLLDRRLKALLSAYIKTCGFLSYGASFSILLRSENAKIARFIYSLFTSIYHVKPRLSYTKKMKLKKNITYSIEVKENAKEILDDLKIKFLVDKIDSSIVMDDDCIGGYLSGCFLASGSCNDPRSANYHLEMQFSNSEFAKNVEKLIKKHRSKAFTPHLMKRRNNYVVYLKRSDQIASFLILIGAIDACMEFENVRVERDYRNIDNRWQICDAANLKKTLDSARTQLEDIQVIEAHIPSEKIRSEKMRWLMRLRKENDESSLRELAELMSEIFDMEISKSNVNHLFRQMHELAKSLRGESDGY